MIGGGWKGATWQLSKFAFLYPYLVAELPEKPQKFLRASRASRGSRACHVYESRFARFVRVAVNHLMLNYYDLAIVCAECYSCCILCARRSVLRTSRCAVRAALSSGVSPRGTLHAALFPQRYFCSALSAALSAPRSSWCTLHVMLSAMYSKIYSAHCTLRAVYKLN